MTAMTAETETGDYPLINLVNPSTGGRFQFCGRWLRPGKATVQDVKRGFARWPGDKVWLNLPPGVQIQLDSGRLQVAGQFAPRAAVADAAPFTALMPKGNESHDRWVQYAVGQGMDREQAVSLTRDQLKARFTAPSFDPDAPPENADVADGGGQYEMLPD
jgi:hypothetical protein